MIIQRIPIVEIIGFFVGYIIIHFLIGLIKKDMDLRISQGKNNSEFLQNYKYITFLFKWFPAIWVIIILLKFLL